MRRTQTVIIGAGQAGLAMSRALGDRGHDHVILERGRIAQRWTERWDSLRLLTPNWMSRLPGWGYTGPDPNGFMSRDEVIGYLGAFARSFDAPVEEETRVVSVTPRDGLWRVGTDRGDWEAESVVVATGHCDRARVPRWAAEAPAGLHQLTSVDYRRPSQLPAGGVLVVGASATGVQLADELRRSGRRVALAVGGHNRLPRCYRGSDIMVWLDALGSLDREVDDLAGAGWPRAEPSLQLVGGDDRRALDLAVLHAQGVELAGRLTGLAGGRARFAGDLAETTADADRRLAKLLGRIDEHIAARGLGPLPPGEPPPPVPTAGAPRSLLLREEGFGSILWAAGYRRSYPWLHAPVLDARGEIRHHRGKTPAAGLYVLGLQFMIRRRSSFLDGVGRDALELAEEITEPRSRRERKAA